MELETGATSHKMSLEAKKQAINLAIASKIGSNSNSEDGEAGINKKNLDCKNPFKLKSTTSTNATTCVTNNTASPTVSSLVSSLTQSLEGKSEGQVNFKPSFVRNKNKPLSKRPFSSFSTCGPQVMKVKESLERRSFILNSDNFGSKSAYQSLTSLNKSKTKTATSVSPVEMSRTSPIKLPEVTSPVKLNATTTTEANAISSTTTEMATTNGAASQEKSPQESICAETGEPSPSKSQSSVNSSEAEESPPPATSATPTSASPSSRGAISNLPKRPRSGKCREVWTLPSPKESPFMKQGMGKDIPAISEDREEIISLPQLVEDHWNKFPLRVRVVKGVLEEQLSSKTLLDLHFLKHTKVVDICDSLNQKFLIPHCSPMQFGVVYCPDVKNENYYFDKVLDIIQAPDMPKVVTCTKKVKGKDERSSLNINEVLIMIEVIKGLHSYSKLTKKPKLKVFSFTERKEKILPGDVIGKFTTDPKKAQFYIPEIIEHFPNPFPLSARVFLDDEYEYPLPDSLTKNPITMLNSLNEDSVVGKLKGEESQGVVNKKHLEDLIELPVVSDIMVSVIPEDEIQLSTIEVLHEDTQSMWKSFVAPSDKVPVCLHPPVSGKSPLQNRLSTLYRKGDEAKWSALEAPPLMKKDLLTIQASPNTSAYQVLLDGMSTVHHYMQPNRSFSSSNSSFDTTRSNSTTDDSDIHPDPELEAFEKIMKSKRDMIRDEPMDTQSSNNRLIRRIEAVESRVATAAPQSIINRLTRRVEALESKSGPRETKLSKDKGTEIDELKTVVETLQGSMKILEDEVKEMKDQLQQVIDITGRKKEPYVQDKTEAVKKENIAVLKSMDSNQILMLLDKLELSQYKEVFAEEAISGEILVECTETVLIEDLDIKEASHCSKLMDVIHGSPATRYLLDSIKASL